VDSKATLRARVRAARRARERALTPAAAEAAAEALAAVAMARPEVRGAARVACYAAAPGEPDTGVLRRALREAGAEVLLPVVDGAELDWAPDDGTTVPGPLGLPQPTGTRRGRDAVAGCDLVLVPALAADRSGARLGQGGGYYDRALAAGTGGPVVAVLHPEELLPAGSVPALPHDVRVDAVLTAAGWTPLPGPR